MYASLSNQLYHMGHYAFAFILTLIVLPRFLFARTQESFLDRTAANFLKMGCLVIIVGYLLVLTKLFEVIGLVAVFALLMLRGYFWSKGAQRRVHARMSVAATIYDVVDGRISLKAKFTEWLSSRKASMGDWTKGIMKAWTTLMQIGLFIAVFAIAAFTHLYDAMKSPAPAFSDGYVGLAWMKYLEQRILFHDGIYPQGCYLMLAFLQKFAAIDPLYILRYTGPVVSLCTMLGLYFVVSRLTKSTAAGLLSAWIFGGVLGVFYGEPWVRQAGTLSQEFAFLYVYPTIYFFRRYLDERDSYDLWTGFAGITVIGLVHSLVFVITAFGVGCAVLAYSIKRFRETRLSSLKVVLVGGVSGVISLIPVGIGKLMGVTFNTSATQYLTSTSSGTSVYIPPLTLIDDAALLGIIVLWIATFVHRRGKSATWLMCAIFGTFMMLLYEFGSYTHSTVITSRSTDIWGLALPFIIGMGAGALFDLTLRIKWRIGVQTSLVACVVFVTCYLVPPTPIVPYKLQWDDDVEAYLRISQEYRPTTYMIVGQQEDYDIVLGGGFHMFLSYFLQNYDPTKSPLTRFGSKLPDHNIPFDVFVFEESPVFEVSPNNSIYKILAPAYKQRRDEMSQLRLWITQYQAAHHKVDIFYKGPHLIVYHFHRDEPTTKQ